MTLSRGSLLMFAELLDAQTLPSTHPNLVALAEQITATRGEIRAALADLDAAKDDEADPSTDA